MQVTYRQIWKIAYPIMISLMMEQLIGLTDTAFLGRVGNIELGAAALSTVYFMAIFMLGFGFSMGAQIMIAHRNGEGNKREIGAIFYEGMVFILLLAALAFALTRWGSAFILGGLIDSPAILAASLEYLEWRAWGFWFAFAALMYRAFYVGIAHTKALTYTAVLMVLLNIVLNYALIFGNWGFPAMGIGGAGLASSIAEVAYFFLFVGYTRFRIDRSAYGFTYLRKLNWGRIRRLLALSGWTMGQYFVAVGVWFVFFLAVEHLGERPLSSANIVRSYSVVWFMVLSAFATVASTLAGNLMGAGRADLVLPAARKSLYLCAAIVLPFLILSAVFPESCLRIYTDDAVLIKESVVSLWVVLASLLWALPGHIFQKSISGIGNTKLAFFIDLCALLAYLVYIAVAIFWLRSSVGVCWIADHVYWAVILIGVIVYFVRANWKQVKV